MNINLTDPSDGLGNEPELGFWEICWVIDMKCLDLFFIHASVISESEFFPKREKNVKEAKPKKVYKLCIELSPTTAYQISVHKNKLEIKRLGVPICLYYEVVA